MFAAFAQSDINCIVTHAADGGPITFGTRLVGLPAGQRCEALLSHLADRALQVIGLAADIGESGRTAEATRPRLADGG